MSSASKKTIVIVLSVLVAAFALVAYFCRLVVQSKLAVRCKPNLRYMEGAKFLWAQEHAKTTNDVPTDSELFGPKAYIDRKPECPMGGTYTMRKVGEPVRCSIPTHTISGPKLRR